MSDYQEKIKSRILAIDRTAMTEEERAVMSMLWMNLGKPVSQAEIARTERWMGCHPTHEADIRVNKLETTTRQVRQIIRDLRIKYHMPILSDAKGYWVSTSEEDARGYLEKQEREAKAQIKSWLETYNCMKTALQMQDSLFESRFFEEMRGIEDKV